MKLMLLAAGLGTRLRPVTETLAKPAVPFLNVPLLFWALEFLRELKPETVVVNLHHLPQTIETLKGQIQQTADEGLSLDLHFSQEADAPLGSGGGLWKARHYFEKDQSFAIANADEVIFPTSAGTLQRLKTQHEANDNIATLLTMRRSDVGTKFGGVWVAGTGDSRGGRRVLGFGRDRATFPQATDGLHYVGVMILSPRIFKYLPQGESNILYDGVTRAIAAGERVSAVTEDLVWFETGSPDDFLHATGEVLNLISPTFSATSASPIASAMAKAVLRRHLNDGSIFWESHDGAKALIADMETGSVARTQIYENLSSNSLRSGSGHGFAVIGSKALVKSARIHNSVVLPGAQASDGTEILNTVLHRKS